jgi:hypothetical protein
MNGGQKCIRAVPGMEFEFVITPVGGIIKTESSRKSIVQVQQSCPGVCFILDLLSESLDHGICPRKPSHSPFDHSRLERLRCVGILVTAINVVSMLLVIQLWDEEGMEKGSNIIRGSRATQNLKVLQLE